MVGGSDAHALGSAGSAWTEVRGARNKVEFLEGLRAGRAEVRGKPGSYWKLNCDILAISRELFREKPFTLLLAPLLFGIPSVTLLNYILERRFAHKWGRAWTRMRGLDGDATTGRIPAATGEAMA